MKSNIYFDNAATTALHPEVLDTMISFLSENFGNPSSIHSMGRKAKSAVENARKTVAELLGTSPSEIFFTSGGTEANNTVMHAAVNHLCVPSIISSELEHHAVLHPIEFYERKGQTKFLKLKHNAQGDIDLQELEHICQKNKGSLLSLMHVNNEIGNILPLNDVSDICRANEILFHTDTVQSIGKVPLDLSKTAIDFLSGSAHKFYGPKGVGILYINAKNQIAPFMHGGAQERNMRGGTENVASVVGLAKALELSYKNMEARKSHIAGLKAYMIGQLKTHFPAVQFNGRSGDIDQSIYHILNVGFPAHPDQEMLLFNLDIEGICVSGGSACSSGTDIGSHVLMALGVDENRANIRFSFSEKNTIEEVDQVMTILKKVLS